MLSRRTWVSALAATSLNTGLGLLTPAAAQAVKPAARGPLFRKLDIYIPAGVGGGWDQTGRGLGAAMQAAALANDITYENKGGKGGTLGLADFVPRFAKRPDALFVSGFVMIGALALNQTAEAIQQLTPIARLTSDTMVLCAAPGKGPQTMAELVSVLRRDATSISFTGGSAGGVDHMLAAMVLRVLGLDAGAMKYLPTASGKEAVAMLASGQAQVAISGYSEFKAGIQDQSLVPLAVSSRKGLFGIASLREQGVDTELANWRAVFAPAGISAVQKDALRKLVVAATETPLWRQTLVDNNWLGAVLYGKDFDNFVQVQQGVATVVASLLKLKR
ncbi:tripartite tricarboxylate transporter substrate-binding protein [Aquabacterium sp.]|uniref:tripartite tricarboxylate transporter substrate-binding protein n=1 Tax=Aquabacterium sp. TaxID=1872578 RepID=UPI002B8AC6E2|nr:tripartite tricarboxylate transporter substrate-binding protein [Aquabacterium sp.]HSW05493.1 tripartite tricarboxylate transporter substrate-binding protein [Aquabacterium sp.]